ncbi:DUF6039 family protein [Microbispora sp. KK1-11]|uniref:DUF6039 family protein n=1 Tax=Microbispora sp. KK1-11 TaxID=2053005 RepID=UPI00115ABF5D|nr:DUF6039 family protein [Microbispora sp. KK1-11]TQS26494.1 hypothetical protein FLW16_24455 [Microbispora sp. KK1-11]
MSDTAVSTLDAGRIRPAQHQSSVPADKVLHSGNSGFIIARNAQLKYSHRAEGRQFFSEVVRHMNDSDLNGASFFCYEEAFGTQDRLHWLIHWKSPNDYGISLEMVDHDETMIDLLESDRVKDDDGVGAWGRLIVEGTMQEKILVPQHGAHHENEEDVPSDLWVDPAWKQSSQPLSEQLNSANAELVLHRVGQAKHEFRKEARYFAFAWQNHVNKVLPGRVTSYLYEETFGVMDQLHWLIHLRSFEDYLTLMHLDDHDPDFRRILEKDFIAPHRGGGTWARTFVDGTLHDTLLVPYQLPR